MYFYRGQTAQPMKTYHTRLTANQYLAKINKANQCTDAKDIVNAMTATKIVLDLYPYSNVAIKRLISLDKRLSELHTKSKTI
jgi:hypothetical protein